MERSAGIRGLRFSQFSPITRTITRWIANYKCKLSVVPAPNLLIIRYGNLLTNYRSFQTFNFNINGQLFSLPFFFFFSFSPPVFQLVDFRRRIIIRGEKLPGEKGQLLFNGEMFRAKKWSKNFLKTLNSSTRSRLFPFFLLLDSLSRSSLPFLKLFF